MLECIERLIVSDDYYTLLGLQKQYKEGLLLLTKEEADLIESYFKSDILIGKNYKPSDVDVR